MNRVGRVTKAEKVEELDKRELETQRGEVFVAIRLLIKHLSSEEPPTVFELARGIKGIFSEILRLGMVNELAIFLGKINQRIPSEVKGQLREAVEQVLQERNTDHEEIEGMFNGFSHSPINQQSPELQGFRLLEFPKVKEKKR